jgi:hypothetical protein
MPLLCLLTLFAITTCCSQCTGLVEKHYCNTIHMRAAMATRLQGLAEQQLLILGYNNTLSIIFLHEYDLIAPLYAKRIALPVIQIASPGQVALRRTCRYMHMPLHAHSCKRLQFSQD